MPIEEVMLDTNDHITLASKSLVREEHWIRELGSIELIDGIRTMCIMNK